MKAIIAIALSMSVTVGSVQATTITDVLSQIAANNPELQSSAAANAAEELSIRCDNSLPPTSIEYSPFFRPGVSGVASSELIVSQEFDFPTLYASRSRQATLERRAADNSTAVRRQELLLEARSALLDLIRLRLEMGIQTARLSDTDHLLELYERSLELGQATQLEVNKTRLEAQSLRRELLSNSSEQAILEQTLIALNGNRPLDLSDLSYDRPAKELQIPEDPSSIALNSADVKAALANVEAAEGNVSLARAGWLPALTVGYRRNTEEKEASNGFLVGASLPIFSNATKTKATDARLKASRLEAETIAMNATASIQSELLQLGRQQEILNTYDIDLIMSTLKLYYKSLNAGQITLTTYYLETSSLYDQLLSYTRLENDIQQTFSRLTSPLL